MIISLILTLVAAVFGVIIAQENTTMVQATFFGYAVQGSMGIFMLLALGVGVVLGILLMVPALIGHSLTEMQSRRKIAQLEYKPSRKKASK